MLSVQGSIKFKLKTQWTSQEVTQMNYTKGGLLKIPVLLRNGWVTLNLGAAYKEAY